MRLRISGGQKTLFFPRNSIESHGTPIKTVTSLKYIYIIYSIIYITWAHAVETKAAGARVITLHGSAFENIIVASGGRGGGVSRDEGDGKKLCNLCPIGLTSKDCACV